MLYTRLGRLDLVGLRLRHSLSYEFGVEIHARSAFENVL